MNATMMEVLSNEGVKLHKEECCVCYEKFIDTSSMTDGDMKNHVKILISKI